MWDSTVKPRVALITGAGGEVGRMLIPALVERGFEPVALDLSPLPPDLQAQCRESVEVDITDVDAMQKLIHRHDPEQVYHLAAILSTHAERDPLKAHRVNVDATLSLYGMLLGRAEPVRFLFPSSIAVYGLPDLETKRAEGALREWQWTDATGVYGCNKRYCELIGSYLARPERGDRVLDFRSVRYPGLISAETLPTGGTTDYAPEMIHQAAQGKPYACFVREDSRLPFMTMPDAVNALLRLADADAASLTRRVYNVGSFSCSAGELRDAVRERFPDAQVGFEPDPKRQAIVDSWPEDVDDRLARIDWEHRPEHGLAEAFDDYLLPALARRYARAG